MNCTILTCVDSLNIDGRLLASEQTVHGGGHGFHVDLPHRGSEKVDNALVGYGHHALAVDLDDAMADAHAAAFGYTAPQQAADLSTKSKGENELQNLSNSWLILYPSIVD